MNEEWLTGNAVKRLLDKSASQVTPSVQAKLDLAILKSVQLHSEKQKRLAKNPSVNFIERFGLWFNRPALSMAVSVLFVAVAVFGVAEFGLQNYDARISETVDLDAAILSDELPPDAYLDPGFINYATELQKNNSVPAEDEVEQIINTLPADFTTSI